MKNKFFGVTLTLCLAFLPLTSGANEEASVEINSSIRMKSETKTEMRIKAETEFEARKMELEKRREDLKAEMEQKREEIKNQMEAKRDEMEQKRENIKDQIETKREEIKDKMEERRETALSVIKERLDKFSENVVKRFNAAIERLETLANRIDSRIAKMEEEGLDVLNAKELLSIAEVKIETAKTSTAGISLESQAVVSDSDTSSTTTIKANFDTLRRQIETAKTDIKAAHTALVDVINTLKPGLRKATSTATTTEAEDDN